MIQLKGRAFFRLAGQNPIKPFLRLPFCEVGSHGDVVDTDHVDQVINDVYEIVKGRVVSGRQKGREDCRSHHTAFGRHGLDGLVWFIAGMIAKAFGIGVGEGNRLMRGFNSLHCGAMPDV